MEKPVHVRQWWGWLDQNPYMYGNFTWQTVKFMKKDFYFWQFFSKWWKGSIKGANKIVILFWEKRNKIPYYYLYKTFFSQMKNVLCIHHIYYIYITYIVYTLYVPVDIVSILWLNSLISNHEMSNFKFEIFQIHTYLKCYKSGGTYTTLE